MAVDKVHCLSTVVMAAASAVEAEVLWQLFPWTTPPISVSDNLGLGGFLWPDSDERSIEAMPDLEKIVSLILIILVLVLVCKLISCCVKGGCGLCGCLARFVPKVMASSGCFSSQITLFSDGQQKYALNGEKREACIFPRVTIPKWQGEKIRELLEGECYYSLYVVEGERAVQMATRNPIFKGNYSKATQIVIPDEATMEVPLNDPEPPAATSTPAPRGRKVDMPLLKKAAEKKVKLYPDLPEEMPRRVTLWGDPGERD